MASPVWGFEYATTPTGLGGLVRTLDAHRTAPRVWIHKLNLGYFQQNSFMENYYEDRETGGAYSLTFSPSRPLLINRVEWAVSWEGRYHTTRIEEPNRRVQNLINSSLGDPTLGAKVSFHEGNLWTLAAAFRGRVLSSPGTGKMSLNTFSPDLILLNSLSLGALRFHLNTGYRLDNTFDVFEKREDNAVPLRSTRFSQGVMTGDSYVVGAAVEAAVGARIAPFVEGAAYYDADGKAIDSGGRAVNVAFSNNPIWITPGVKARVAHRIIGELAADLGMLSKRFPGEDEILPDWKVLVGVSFLGFSREPAAVPQQTAAPAPPAATAQPATPPTLGPPSGGEGVGGGESAAAPQPVAVAPALPVAPGFTTVDCPAFLAGQHCVVPPLPAAGTPGDQQPVAEERGAGVPSLLPFHVSFEFKQSDIPPASEPVLDEVALTLLENPSLVVRVEGHADQRGPEWSNRRVSRLRAAAVVNELVAHGVDPKRVIPAWYGNTRPIALEDSVEAHAKNRRVEFVVVEGTP